MRKTLYTSLLCTLFVLLSLAHAQDYSITKLPALAAGHTSASAINENGQITGSSNVAGGGSHAFLWSRTAGILDLGAFDGNGTHGNAINSEGDVAGWTDIGIAFLWTPKNGLQTIGPPPVPYTTAYGVNDSLQIVGSYGDWPSTSFLWTPSDGMQDFGTLGCVNCGPAAINENGQVVGSFELPDQSYHALLWTQADGITDLGTLGGASSAALAINNAGQVVGAAQTASGDTHAFFWTAATGMKDLGTLPGETNSWAEAIDANGRAVGSSWGGPDNGMPFSWTQTGGMTQLGPFSKHLAISDANGVNTAGLILIRSYSHHFGGYLSSVMTPLMYTTLTSSSNPSQSGQPVTFTANIGSRVQGPPPDGELVTFMSGAKTLASAPLQAGVASFTMMLTATRTIKAVYVGDSNYASTKPVSLKQVVEK